MFDDLDDPDGFGTPASGVRDAVVARGVRIRRQRRAAWATSGVAGVAAVAVIGFGLRGPLGTSSLAPVSSSKPSTSAPALAHPATRPAVTRPPAAPKDAPATPPPGPATLPPASYAPAPGPAGYTKGSVYCLGSEPGKQAPGNGPDQVSLTLDLPAKVIASHDKDAEPTGSVVLRNDGSTPVSFQYVATYTDPVYNVSIPNQSQAWNDSGDVSAYYDVMDRQWADVDLQPGQTLRVPVFVRTTECAQGTWTNPDTGKAETWEQPLPAGTYHVTVPILWRWGVGSNDGGREYQWVSPVSTLRVTG